MKTDPIIVLRGSTASHVADAARGSAAPAGFFRKIHNVIPHGWHASVYAAAPLMIPATALGGTTGMQAVRLGALLTAGAGMPLAAAITKGVLPTERAGAKLGVQVTTTAEAMLPLKRLTKVLLPVMGASLVGGMLWSRFIGDDNTPTSTTTPTGIR
jgi:hypothetical protein